jgi:hypothetical protein
VDRSRQVLPSPEAARHDWQRFEVIQSHCASPGAGRAARHVKARPAAGPGNATEKIPKCWEKVGKH